MLVLKMQRVGQGRVGAEQTEILGDVVHHPGRPPGSFARPRHSAYAPLRIADRGDVIAWRRCDEETYRIHRGRTVKRGGGGRKSSRNPRLHV